MSESLQNIIIVSAVFLAVAYLVIHYVRRKRKKDACEACRARQALEDSRRKPLS